MLYVIHKGDVYRGYTEDKSIAKQLVKSRGKEYSYKKVKKIDKDVLNYLQEGSTQVVRYDGYENYDIDDIVLFEYEIDLFENKLIDFFMAFDNRLSNFMEQIRYIRFTPEEKELIDKLLFLLTDFIAMTCGGDYPDDVSPDPRYLDIQKFINSHFK